MHIDDFLVLAKQFSNLGDAVGAQLIAVVFGNSVEDQNPNALRMCLPLLKALGEHGIDGALDVRDAILQHLDP
jgi:hypothetical protein